MIETIQQWAREIGVASEILALGIGAIVGLILPRLFRSRTNNARTFGQVSPVTHRAQSPYSTKPSNEAGLESLMSSSGSVTVNGQQIAISPEKLVELQQLLRQGKIIQAIKSMREVTNLSLADAKSVTELLQRSTLT